MNIHGYKKKLKELSRIKKDISTREYEKRKQRLKLNIKRLREKKARNKKK